jgi:large subunit ribosomal protein L4
MKADITTLDAKKAGTVDLSEEVFGLEPRVDILHRMVRYQLAKRQAGTHHAKDRSLVSGTRKKMYKQKGTGRARHGNKLAPQFRGGGKAFGPVPRSHAHDLTKKFRALALKHALSSKARSNELIVLDKAELSEPKTKILKEKFAALGVESALIISGAEADPNFALAARNIPEIDVLVVAGLNVYDILRRRKLILTKDALAAIEERCK